MFTAIEPANQWGWSENFLNRIGFLLETIIWQNSYDPKKKAQHNANKPKPYIPPFLKKKTEPSGISKEAEVHTTDDIKNILSMPRG